MNTSCLRIGFLLLIVCGSVNPVGAGNALIGNLNPPVPPSLPGIVTGTTAYAYLVYPPDQVSSNQQGFRMDSISMLLDFPTNALGVSFQMSAALYTAQVDPANGAWKPGISLCSSLVQSYTVFEPGIHSMIVSFAPCEPVQLTGHYFLVLSYDTPIEADLPVDGFPQPGIVFRNDGSGWTDMFDHEKAPPGKSIIWGDIIFVSLTVEEESSAWSGIKRLYR